FNYINVILNEDSLINIYTILFYALLVLIPGFVDWNVSSLMETGLFTILVTTISLMTLKSTRNEFTKGDMTSFTLMILLFLLTRPESLLLAPIFIFLKTFNDFQRQNNFSN